MIRRLLCVAVISGAACGAPQDSEPYAWDLPAHVPEPAVPGDNPMTMAKAELGRHLFYEERLSVTGTHACASCHEQRLAFTDGAAAAEGADGTVGPRSAMSLANVAYFGTLTWGNPLLQTLEQQALVPLFLDHPLELGAQFVIDDALDAFSAEPAYRDRFALAFPDDPEPVTVDNVVAALASFERTLISVDSPYDRYLAGDGAALGPGARRGLALFESPRLGCAGCHGGVLQAGCVRGEGEIECSPRFENTGLYDVDGGYPPPNVGLYEFTHDAADNGKFKVPSLRNIAVTAPYMHDGSKPTLTAVIDHFASGGVGSNKSAAVAGFEISDSERLDLIMFLEALTDASFLTDPRFADPSP